MCRANSSTPTSTRRARIMSGSISSSNATTALTIGFTQIAGLVARRIMSFVKEGDRVEAGERIGLIRFGSRVDVYLPAGTGSAGAARPADHRRRDDPRRNRRRPAAQRQQPVTEPPGTPRAAAYGPLLPMRSPRWRCASALPASASESPAIGRRRWSASSARACSTALTGASRGLLRAQSKFGAELDSLSRQYRLRNRAGADHFPLVAQGCAALRLDRGAGAGGLLRASPGAIQRAHRYRRPAAQVGGLQYRRPGAGRSGADLRSDLPVADQRQRSCSAAGPWCFPGRCSSRC